MTELDPALFRIKDASLFVPKLTTDERCGILAAHAAGVRTEALALAYGVNRRTVGHIVNPHSRSYKDTRKVMEKMGKEAFIKAHLTDEVKQRLNKAAKRPELTRPHSQNASRKAGIHTVKPDQCLYSHRLEVKYFGDRDPKGWYVRDLDSKSDPDIWYHNGNDSLISSQNALALAEANLTDE